KTPADFEKPLDANKDGTYEVTVVASDGSKTDSVALSVVIEDLKEGGPARITSDGGGSKVSKQISENTRSVTTVAAEGTDPIKYSVVSGKDASLFSIDSKTGALSVKSAPNFEKPADGGANNVYDVVVKATSGSTSDTQTISVAVKDVNE